MRKFLLASVLTALLVLPSASAAAEPPLSDAHLNKIRLNCVEVQSSLTQLHASDALLRVNRGQLFESISTKLMAPFNSRVALNKLDGSGLLGTTVEYERALSSFRNDYKSYEEDLAAALAIDCQAKPAEFYHLINSARRGRELVHGDVLALQKYIKQYSAQFEELAATVEEVDR